MKSSKYALSTFDFFENSRVLKKNLIVFVGPFLHLETICSPTAFHSFSRYSPFSSKLSTRLEIFLFFYFSGITAAGELTTKVDIRVLLLELFFTLYGSLVLKALLLLPLSFFPAILRRKASYTFFFITKSTNIKAPWRQLIMSKTIKILYWSNSGKNWFI